MEGPKSQNAKGFQNPPQQKKPNRKTKLGRYYIERLKELSKEPKYVGSTQKYGRLR